MYFPHTAGAKSQDRQRNKSRGKITTSPREEGMLEQSSKEKPIRLQPPATANSGDRVGPEMQTTTASPHVLPFVVPTIIDDDVRQRPWNLRWKILR